MNALDNVNITIDYPRPFYTFEDLDGEKGNPIYYWKDAIGVIKRNGFKKEAEQITKYYSKSIGGMILPNVPYEDQFNFLYRYLDFNPKEEKISEDEEFIYVKIQKQNTIHHNSQQPILFFNIDMDSIKEGIDNGEDFSIQNCYGRTILHYIDDPKVLSYFLEHNKEKEWVSLFHLDAFNSSLLQVHDNFDNFMTLLNAMYEEDPELTKIFFTGTNLFNDDASGTYLKLLDYQFNGIKQENINEAQWKNFGKSLPTIKLVNPELHINILATIKDMPIFKDCQNKPDSPQYRFYMHSLLDVTLAEKSSTNTPKKIKI